MKKSIVYLGLALVSFINVAIANESKGVSAAPAMSVTHFAGTPLCTAISKGEIDFVKKMVEYGADINERSNGMTPLMVAARYNQVEIVKFLLEKGANPKDQSDNGFTALRWAEATGSKDVAAVLAKG